MPSNSKKDSFLGIDNNILMWVLAVLGVGAAALFMKGQNNSPPSPQQTGPNEFTLPLTKKPGCGCSNKNKTNVSNSMM